MTTDPNKPAPAAPARTTEADFLMALRRYDEACVSRKANATVPERLATATAHRDYMGDVLLNLFRRARGDEGAMTGLIEAVEAWIHAKDHEFGDWNANGLRVADDNLRRALDAAKRAGGA